MPKPPTANYRPISRRERPQCRPLLARILRTWLDPKLLTQMLAPSKATPEGIDKVGIVATPLELETQAASHFQVVLSTLLQARHRAPPGQGSAIERRESTSTLAYSAVVFGLQ
jgi:hypothetical protein